MVKKYSNFVLERLGVPEGIVKSATLLYELILYKIEQSSDTIIEGDVDGLCYFNTVLPINVNIKELSFKDVNFEITVALNDKYKDIKCASWGVFIKPTSERDYKLYHEKSKLDSFTLVADFISVEGNTFADMADYLKKERHRMIGVLSHELKHVYDKYMIGHELLPDVIDYQTWSKTRTGFGPIDEFIYYLYMTSNIENLVRPSEVAGQIDSLDVSKSEFKEFLEKTPIYEDLFAIRNWSYKNLKNDLLSDIDEIRKRFVDIPDEESDEDIVETVLENAYSTIVEEYATSMADVLNLKNVIQQLMNKVKNDNIDFFEKYMRKKFFKNKDEFYEFWEKKINFEAEKVFKKIAKLYDMCKDDEVNPIMAKINQRVDNKCIIDPNVYNELLKTKAKKLNYKK